MTKISPQKRKHSPRSRMFAHLSRYLGLNDIAEWTGETAKDRGSSPLPSKDGTLLKTLESGCMQLYSFFSPGLPGGSYNAIVTQDISITQAGNTTTEPPLKTSKQFSVEGPKWSVDPKVVDSVYPPPAYKDYPSILPDIVFNDPHYPWSAGMEKSQDTDMMQIPWLGLLVFTESEITPSAQQINAMKQKLPAQNPKSKFFSMKVSDLVSMDSLISEPVPPTGDTVADFTLVDVVLVSSALFDGIFGAGGIDSINPNSGQSSQLDLTRFMYMSHVKNVNVTNLPGEKKITDDDVGQFSVTVWRRTGPLDFKDDTTLYVHVASLVNVAEHITIPFG
ncbi:hypothetical protein ZTR_06264 [Talaromyces verruculosus]|nr:hypothetical protein ZTR_06264 [Talaromyces verruculosus]